eukprot:5247242-Pyramimonas_sp.AAC.1
MLGYPVTMLGYPATMLGYPDTMLGYPATMLGYPDTLRVARAPQPLQQAIRRLGGLVRLPGID